MKEIIKDLILSILIVVSIGLILSVIFYDKVSIGKVVPQAEKYSLTEEMKAGLEDNQLKETQEVIVNYYIDAFDLKKYENTKEYIKGKDNPFAEVGSQIVENNVTSDTGNNTAQEGFYKNEGTK